MSTKQEVLAWHQHPQPGGTIFNAETLSDKNRLIEIFRSCGEDAGYITSDGWMFLFGHFSIHELYEADAVSGWLNANDKTEWVSDLVYQSMMAGYDPINKEKGDFDTQTDHFLTLDGYKRKIDWTQIGKLADML